MNDPVVILAWSGPKKLLRDVFLMCKDVRWVHSRSAGLDNVLFPELVASDVPLTNGSGVFSQSLGEFALAAILYFAKDFRRMIRNQVAGVWEQFDVEEIDSQTVGIVGYGDIGRAVAQTGAPHGHDRTRAQETPARRGLIPWWISSISRKIYWRCSRAVTTSWSRFRLRRRPTT